MQVASASTGTASTSAKSPMTGETGSAMTAAADPRYAQYKVIRRNGAVVPFEPAKITIAMTKAFLAVNGGQGRRVRARARAGREADRRCRRRADEAQAGRRRDPHRGNPGPGRARDDARRRARGRARLRALPRAPLAGARAGKIGEGRQDHRRRDPRRRRRRVAAARHGAPNAAGARIVRRTFRRRARAHPQGHAQGSLQRRADGRSAQVRGARRAHADREGSRVQLRHRAAAPRFDPPRGARRGSLAARHDDQVRRILPAVRAPRDQDRPPERVAAAIRHGNAGQGARRPSATCSSATSACRRSTTATS